MAIPIFDTIPHVHRLAPRPVSNRLHFLSSENPETIELSYWDFLSGQYEIYQKINRPEGANDLVWLENNLYAWIGKEKRSVFFPFPSNTGQPLPFIFHVRIPSLPSYVGQYSGQEEGQIHMRFDTERKVFERLNIPPERSVLHANDHMIFFFSKDEKELIWEGWDLQSQELVWKRPVNQICKELGLDSFQGVAVAKEVIHEKYCLIALRNHGLLCLDWETGNIIWFQAEAYNMIRLHENHLIQVDALFYKEMDLITGAMLSKIEIRNAALTIGMTTPANDLFGVTDQFIVRPDLRHGMIAVHRRDDGQLYDHFQFSEPENVRLSRQFVVAQDNVWALTSDGTLYHFRLN